MNLTKDHYEFAIKTLEGLLHGFHDWGVSSAVINHIAAEISQLSDSMEKAPISATQSVYNSHEVLCKYKGTNAKEAFNMNPGMVYAMGVAGEAGELLNAKIKAIRTGGSTEQLREAVISEIPDVFIYMTLLAMYYDIDLEELVREKSKIVVERALSGHYGPPVVKT